MERLSKIQTEIQNKEEKIDIAFEDEGRIGVLFINNKQDHNAFGSALIQEFCEKMQVLDLDPKVKIIVVTSKLEKIFAAGGKISEFENVTYEGLTYNDLYQPMERCLQDTKKPLIAAVNGIAYGGGFEISLGCDMIVVREDSKLCLPEINLGLIPGCGGTQRLSKIVGRLNASRLVLSGEPISAQRAYELGLAVEIFKKQNFYEDVINFAKKFTKKPQHTLMIAKKALRTSEYTNLRDGLDYERSVFTPLYNTEAKQVGVTAFKNKQKPNFDNV